MIRKRPQIALLNTSCATDLLICGTGLDFPNAKSDGFSGVKNGGNIGWFNSSKKVFVSGDSVIVGKTCL